MSKLERYEQEPHEHIPQSSFVPMVKVGCICTGTVMINGEEYSGVRNPNCMEHGSRSRYVERPAKFNANARVPGTTNFRRKDY